jgi:S1-C subfamily serine protease
LVKLDPEHDLALLKVQNVKNHSYAKIAKSARVGEQIINVGSPIIFEFLVSEGIVAALHFKDKTFKSTYLITTAMINPGSSGGGAFNAAGELVGVNTMSVGMFGWTGISMAVDIESIKGFLK